MSKLTGAALDKAVANAMGLKSVNDCQKWVGLTPEELGNLFQQPRVLGRLEKFYKIIEAALKEKNNA